MTATMLNRVSGAARSIGAILIDAGRLGPQDAERILNFQREEGIRFGEAGIRLGLLTEADILFALSLQFDYPYLSGNGPLPVSEEVVTAYRPFSPEGERIRSLRSQLQMRWFDESGKRTALTVIGATRGEGRSYVAANLAVAFAQLGERTLLIDGDMRAPRQHALFKLDNESGLSNLLAGRLLDQAVTFVPGLPGLGILTSGPTPPNPAELLSRPAFDRILERSMSTFDVVLIDTPSMDSGADAALLTRFAGAALAVARKDHTRATHFAEMVGGLTESGIRVVGSVMIDAPGAGVAAQRAAARK